jgi:hypothetical protein
LEVTEVQQVCVSDITDADALSAGFPTRAELLEYMASANEAPLLASSTVFRVQIRHAGDGDRVELALEDQLSPEDVFAIATKLTKLDAKRPWTQKTLAIISQRPRVAASQLAAALGYADKLEFKEEVRKLKKLGLTQSFEVGYEVSPRGRAYLAANAGRKRKRASKAGASKRTGKKATARRAADIESAPRKRRKH